MTQKGLYNYIEFLIKEARILIGLKDYKEAVWRCLIESGDGNSGWIREVDALFRNKPQTIEDINLRAELKDVNLRAAKGLLNNISLVNHYLVAADVLAAEICLARADQKKIPPELSEKLSTLLPQCEKY